MARHYCRRCHKADVACICSWVSPVPNQTRVVILQHPDEVKKALGTARIASLCLTNVELLVGVDFSRSQLIRELRSSEETPIGLLYPAKTSITLVDWLKTAPLSPCVIGREKTVDLKGSDVGDSTFDRSGIDHFNRTLIVLDGTWRNVREIMLANDSFKWLQCLTLQPDRSTNYRIRKAPSDSALSTVEAISLALSVIEPSLNVSPMLGCFEKMVDYQISRMGKGVYHSNYVSKLD